MAVDTNRVANRRRVRYENIHELLADAERCMSGRAHTIGNWTLAQIFDHLARSMNASVDGMAASFSAPARFVLRFFKKRMLSSPMKPGFRCPTHVELVLRPGDGLEVDRSLENLRDAVSRFQEAMEFPAHPAFGKLTRDEWNKIALRHAELHMSFVVLD